VRIWPVYGPTRAQCCYFDGAQGTIVCQSEVDTLRPYWRKLLVSFLYGHLCPSLLTRNMGIPIGPFGRSLSDSAAP
jgi:hypothetical protein